MSATPSITIETDGPFVKAKVNKKLLDDAICSDLLAQVVSAAKTHNAAVALDMSEVKFLPSMAIGTLVNLNKILKAANQKFVLVAVQKTVRDIFTLTHMDKVFKQVETMEDAATALAATA